MTDTRLQKVLAERGIASRRAAERLIAGGRVSVDGEIIRVLGTKVAPDAVIEVDERPTSGREPKRYLLLNKPVGIVSTARDDRGRPTVVSLVGAQERLYPVGRLDADSEGLLLMTNDGTWADLVNHPRNGHEREYQVAVRGHLTSESLATLRRGVPLDEGTARAVDVRIAARTVEGGELRMILVTGWKRQVRRMCAAVGLNVTRLVRVRLGPLLLGPLAAGTWRELTPREVRELGTPKAGLGTRAGAPLARPARAAPPRARPTRTDGSTLGEVRGAHPRPSRPGAPTARPIRPGRAPLRPSRSGAPTARPIRAGVTFARPMTPAVPTSGPTRTGGAAFRPNRPGAPALRSAGTGARTFGATRTGPPRVFRATRLGPAAFRPSRTGAPPARPTTTRAPAARPLRSAAPALRSGRSGGERPQRRPAPPGPRGRRP